MAWLLDRPGGPLQHDEAAITFKGEAEADIPYVGYTHFIPLDGYPSIIPYRG